MKAQDVLERLSGMGLRLRAVGDGIGVSPSSVLTEETKALIKAHKAALWELLTRQQVSECWDRFKADAATIMRLETWELRKEALSRYRAKRGEVAANEMWLWLVHHYGRPLVMDS